MKRLLIAAALFASPTLVRAEVPPTPNYLANHPDAYRKAKEGCDENPGRGMVDRDFAALCDNVVSASFILDLRELAAHGAILPGGSWER